MLYIIFLYCTICYTFKTGYLRIDYSKNQFIKRSLIIHNYISILLSVYIFTGIFIEITRNHYSLVGNKLNHDHVNLVHYMQVFHLSKYYELMDSMFMILRNKTSQLSGLHIYHHASTIVYTWLIIHLYPGGDMYMGALLNSWIHIWMYLYYCLSTKLDTKNRIKYLWWNKILTLNQITQFCINMIHSVFAMIYGERTILFLSAVGFLHQLSFFVLFWKFYYQKYVCKTRLVMKLCNKTKEIYSELQRYELKNNND